MIFICLLLAGCSTVATVAGGKKDSGFQCDENFTISRIYSGVSNDIRFLAGTYQDKGLIFLDLPFSFVADTIVLPFSIYTQLRYGNLCDKMDRSPTLQTHPNLEDAPDQKTVR
jgi:uncharacterized protein YceK